MHKIKIDYFEHIPLIPALGGEGREKKKRRGYFTKQVGKSDFSFQLIFYYTKE